tara:strand:- start:276 stop:1580 length:1305 start_codon:yes stop_codon:yes gene_type:complete
MEDLQNLLGGDNQPQMPGGNEYTIKDVQQALDDARFANHGLTQNESSEWRKTVRAGSAEQTGDDMEEIKGLFDQLAAAASQAQGDRALTNQYIAEIARLNAKLKECLDLLLRIIAQLMQKDSDSTETVERLRATIQNAPDLNLIKTELQALITYISTQQVDRTRFQSELQRLADDIKRMCQKGEELEERLRRDNSGGNSGSDGSSGGKVSEEIGGDMSKTSDPTDGWSVETDDGGRVYYVNNITGESQWEKPTELATAATAESDFEKGVKKTKHALAQPHESTSPFADPSVTAGVFRKQAQTAEKKVRLKDFQKYVDSEEFKSVADRAGKRARLLNWWKDHDYTHMGEPDAYTKKEHSAMNEAVMSGRPAASALTKGGRRTRKKRAGWRTPEKGSPMRTLYTKENKKRKHTKKKKNKRKKRKKKGTRKRRNRKR